MAWARWALKVLFPTPPFPDNTRILCFTFDSFTPISAIAESRKRKWEEWRFSMSRMKLITYSKNTWETVHTKLLSKWGYKIQFYLGRGPLWLRRRTGSGWDNPDMMQTFLLAHLWYQGSLKVEGDQPESMLALSDTMGVQMSILNLITHTFRCLSMNECQCSSYYTQYVYFHKKSLLVPAG